MSQLLRDKVLYEEFKVFKEDIQKTYATNEIIDQLKKKISNCANFENFIHLDNELNSMRKRFESFYNEFMINK